ncbi:MAG: DUF4012 domain-containing protein, partial [Chloroflexi bacterium]|nr:DUF4012 domain-containing protein [Chloroflexota bacterium]
ILLALELSDSAMRRYESVGATLPTALADPVQLAFGGFLAPLREVRIGRSEIDGARQALARARQGLAAVGLDLGVNQALEDVDAILSAAGAGFSAAEFAFEAANNLAALTSQGAFSSAFAATARTAIPAAADQMARARREASRGLDAIANVKKPPVISPLTIGDIRDQLLVLSSALERAGDFVSLMGYVLGLDAPRTFLVLGQDDNEIRATGGFIGSVHEIVIDGGDLWVPQYLDSFDVDPTFEGNPVGPDAFCRYMLGGPCILAFRDSNWWPDFPTSAELALDLYETSLGIKADGVIAVDRWFMADLVDASGGVLLPGRDLPIDGSLARRYASSRLYPCRPENIKQRPSRCFVEDLMDHLLTVAANDAATSRAMLETAVAATAGKHILTYLRDPQASSVFRSLNWDGHLIETTGDYLMIVDTSVYSKVHDFVNREIHYEVTPNADGSAEVRLRIGYELSDDAYPPVTECVQIVDNWNCHWNYVRVLAPLGSVMRVVPDFPLPDGTMYESYSSALGIDVRGSNTFAIADDLEFGKTEMNWLITLSTGQSARFELSYTVPNAITLLPDGTHKYQLTLQKQPGTRGEKVSVLVRLPRGSAVVGTLDEGAVTGPSGIEFPLTFDTDKVLSVRFAAE